ncbi:hypothetical protein NQ318_007844 [Aromia moschata]|uniref:Reverse transcriptase domain-containing protein n=1 Tax=Aromia moschata TaxID=1265417 RepID=A0AAV8Z1S5_9CUCU|nr:hypothetical protein NQ318_007844 [Aromia moschata]
MHAPPCNRNAWGSKVSESSFAFGRGNPAYPSYARRGKVGESNFVYGCGKPAYSGYAWGARLVKVALLLGVATPHTPATHGEAGCSNPAYHSCARRSKVSEGNFVFGYGNVRNRATLTHLLYMDDLKLFSGSKANLQALIGTTRTFSDDIKMSFGLDKCATLSIVKGAPHNNPEVYADIHQLPPEEQYRYLGVCQDGRINHTQLKKEFQDKYKSRVTKLLNTLLSGGNLIKAINSWAVPVLTYSFGIVKWSVTDLDELDRLTRRLLTKFRRLHTNSSVIRLYLPRRRGGRGLLNIKNQCLNQEASLRRKLLTNRDPLITAVAREDAGYTPLSLGCELIPVDQVYTPNPNRKNKDSDTPMWKKRLEKNIDEY